MKLLLADDHRLFRDALLHYIERAEPGAEILQAGDIPEVLRIMESDSGIDLVLLDFRMPGMKGLKGFEKVRVSYPDVPVAIISGLAEKEDVRKALKQGAAGYFPKTMPGADMIAGIRRIMQGERYIAIDPDTDEIMASYYADKEMLLPGGMRDGGQASIRQEVRLTRREKEVLGYLLKGAPNKEIARELNLQTVTIKLHVRSICQKLGVKNRTQAALVARDMGLG